MRSSLCALALVTLSLSSLAQTPGPAPAGGLVPAPIGFEQARRAGPGHPWQARAAGVNLDSRGKVTGIPLFALRDVAGLPFALALHHGSQAVHTNPALGPKWSHTFDLHLDLWGSGHGNRAALVHGDQRVQLWKRSGAQWTPVDGYADSLTFLPSGPVIVLADGTRLELELGLLAGKLRYRLLRIVDRNGNALRCNYRNDRLVSVKGPSGRTCVFVYDEEGRLIRIDLVVGSFVRTWSMLRDAGGALQGVRAPEVTVQGLASFFDVFLTVDLNDNLTSFTDRSGATTQFGYDPAQPDALATIEFPGAGAPPTSKVLSEPTAGTTRFVDELGAVATFEHDARGRLRRETRGSGATEGVLTRSYADPDAPWSVSGLVNTAGDAWSIEYDAARLPVAVTAPSGGRFDYTYDAARRLVTIERPLVTDAWGVTAPDRQRVDFLYDAAGNVTAVEAATGPGTHVDTLYAYDALGQLVQRTDANGETSQFSYDGYGNLVSLTTPEGRSFAWLFESAAATFGFAAPNAFVDGLGVRFDLQRDEWGRRTALIHPGGTRTYEYDAMNRLVRTSDAQGTTDFAYDARGQRTDEMRGATALQWSYLPNGLRSSMTVLTPTSARAVSYQYTDRNELAQVDDGGSVTTLEYDLDGRLVRRTLANGVRMEKLYVAGLLKRTQHILPSGALLASFTNVHQADLSLSIVLEGVSVTRYGYDALHRLVREQRTGANAYEHLWFYDAAGRRQQSIVDGQVTTIVRDRDGLPAQVLPPGLALPDLYVWDANARLVQSQRNGIDYAFAWDEEGRPLRGCRKTRDARPIASGTADGSCSAAWC